METCYYALEGPSHASSLQGSADRQLRHMHNEIGGGLFLSLLTNFSFGSCAVCTDTKSRALYTLVFVDSASNLSSVKHVCSQPDTHSLAVVIMANFSGPIITVSVFPPAAVFALSN